MRRCPVFIPLLIHALFFQFLNAQDNAKEYNYSTIAEAYGYTENNSKIQKSEILRLALSDAKRNLLEKSMMYIKSYTKVENYVIEYDLVESESEGFIRIIEQKDLGPTDDNKYCVWLKAEVIYHFKNGTDSQNQNQDIDRPLSVKIWTDQEKYTVKEKVIIYLLPNKNCYLKVIYKDAENNVLQIFPNQHKKNNFFEANKLFQIPDESDSYEFTVSSPFGEEKISVLASTSPLGDLQLESHGSDFYKFIGTENDLSFKTRGVKITNKEDPVEFFQESCKIVVTDNQ